MAGADAQAGFYYQNLTAALYALDLIEFGSRLRTLTLENPARAKHIDDVIVDSADGSKFVQVKWSEDESSALTLYNLLVSEVGSPSLLEKLARGFQQISNEDGKKEVVLLSNRKAGTRKQPGSGFNKSLSEFIAELHQPFVDDPQITDVRHAPAFAAYESILNRLLTTSRLRDYSELSRFLKCLRFSLNQPTRDTLIDRVRGRLERLGIEQRQYATLLDEIVKWSISGHEIYAEDVLRVLGLRDRFVDRLSHHFPVDDKVWVRTPTLFGLLDKSIGTLDSGFVLVEGEPGSGKSTALTKYLSERSDLSFGYYCFVPSDRTMGNERLGDNAFVRSICIGLKNAFPDIEFPRAYAAHTIGLLNDWLATLSAAGRRVVFVVDGVDHVDRKTRQSLVAQPLTSVLDGELPANVLIVLSSRYPEALPPAVLRHIKSDSRRHIQMPRFGRNQVREFMRLRNVGIADELLEAATNVSGGVPIYLEYLASQLESMTNYEQGRYLKSVPTLRDKKIDHYHEHLWEQCTGDEGLLYILATLAIRDEFTTPEALREIMQLVGVNLTLAGVHDALSKVRHVLRVSDAQSVAIRHSSLAEFISERTAHLSKDITRAILQWYAQHPTADEAWRHQFRHLFDTGEFSAVLDACNDAWLKRAWVCHRPLSEIQRNLDIAWCAASVNRDLIHFVRIGLLKQQVALIDDHLDVSEIKVAELLLDMGLTDVALGRVWDGERRTCGPIAFAEHALRHTARTGRLLPAHILNAGLGEGPGPKANVEATQTWYRARAHVDDPVRLIAGIANTQWRTKSSDGHATDSSDVDGNRRLNLSVQLAVIRELAARADITRLESVRNCGTLPADIRTAASAAAALVLARIGEVSEAIKILSGVDFADIPVHYTCWISLQLASKGLDGYVAYAALPAPALPTDLVTTDHKFNTDFVSLYDELRFYFLKDAAAVAWFDAAVTGIAEPARTLVTAVGRLARLWIRATSGLKESIAPLYEVKAVIEALDPEQSLFNDDDRDWNYPLYTYRRSAHRLYEKVWSCAGNLLSKEELLELSHWWTHNRSGKRAMRYPEATRALAVMVHEQVPGEAQEELRGLLSLSEKSARLDEETSVLVAGLMESASAWGRCGFPVEAERLWGELLNVACGVHSRKDYQFSEILMPLRLAHIQDPGGTLDRIEEQLVLAHQLDGTAASKMVAVSIEGLITLISKFSPGLALVALVHEEPLIFRERAIRSVVYSLLDKEGVDRGLVLSLVATMARWENYRHFNDETAPTMFAVFASALAAKDYDVARAAYDMARHVLLVEKEMPSELARWVSHWISLGNAPTDVRSDQTALPPLETQVPVESDRSSSESERLLLDLDELANGEITKLEERLDAIVQAELKEHQLLEVERSYQDWRSALQKAARRQWNEEQQKTLQGCIDWFGGAVIERLALPGLAARKSIEELIPQLAAMVSEKLTCTIEVELLDDLFETDEWIDRLIQHSRSSYTLDRELRGRLPVWIASAPLAKVEVWKDFCLRRCSGEARAEALIAVAERLAATKPADTIEILFQARESISEFFFEYQGLARRICSKVLELDINRGLDLLFEGFRHQYQRFPQTIIYRLDLLLELAGKASSYDAVELYNLWAAHNRRLAAGLSLKEINLEWLRTPVSNDFAKCCVNYLVALFDYPEVDVRLLAINELVDLLAEHEELIDAVLAPWATYSDGQKEFIASLFHSLALAKQDTSRQWVPKLVDLGKSEGHYNLRSTIAAAVTAVSDAGTTSDQKIVKEAQLLIAPPRILLAQPPVILAASPDAIRLPPYVTWALRKLGKTAAPGKLKARMVAILRQIYPDPETGLENEAAVHRTYNINTNFDVIEIGGGYDRAVRSALNRALYSLMASNEINSDVLKKNEDVLRLRDPTDSLVRRVPRPTQITWVDNILSDDEFTQFVDIEKLTAGFGVRDGEWVTLFECTEQRTGGNIGSPDPQRASKARVIVFGVARGATPSIEEIIIEANNGSLAPRRNLYRSELIGTGVRDPSPGIITIVSATTRTFRGHQAVDAAAIAEQFLHEAHVSRAVADPLGYVIDGVTVVRSVEWQEAFDQGRRLHEPRSEGFLLQIKRDALGHIGQERGIEFWAYFTGERTTDRYKPEHEMNWRSHSSLFPLKLHF